MTSAAEILKQIHKDHGPEIAVVGAAYSDCVRLPTGVFPFDLASGGGFPMGRVSVIYGPESSGKTNLALKAIAQGQLLFPTMKAVFVDAENAYDPGWASQLGVDNNRLILVHPEFAEQAVDLIEAFLYANDVFAVVLDSVAALITQNEIDSSAEKAVVGGASLTVGKLARKAPRAFMVAKKENDGFAPALICINQIRLKIGVMFGNPETMPGGNALKFASSMTVRIYGKSVVEKKINPNLPAYKDTSLVIQKYKVPILAQNAIYKIQMLHFGGNVPGHVSDWNTLKKYMEELDYLTKAEGGGWLCVGEPFKTQEQCKEYLYGNPEVLLELRQAIISELMDAGSALPPNEEDVTTVPDGVDL